MSQNPPASFSDERLRAENRSSGDEEGSRVVRNEPSLSPRPGAQDAGRPRPARLHPSMPMEPKVDPGQVRSIGVHSILNPPVSDSADLTGNPGDEGLGIGVQSPAPPTRRRQTSSLSDHSVYQGGRLSQSPGIDQRRIITPASPSARFARDPSRHPSYSGPVSSAPSPLIHGSRSGIYSAPPGSSFSADPVTGPSPSFMGTQPPASVSLHSVPTLHSPRISAGPPTNPNSHEAGPRIPHSTYSPFGHPSPAVMSMTAPHTAPPFQIGYGATDPGTRLPPAVEGQRSGDEPQGSSYTQGKIPFYLDLKSGSSSQAAKRKANSDASRRFRHRKRNGEEMEQKITSQQNEIQKQAESIQRQADEIRALTHELEYYRSERDFYRAQVARTVPLTQMPVRPPSPRSFRIPRPNSEPCTAPAWHNVEASRPVVSTIPTGQPVSHAFSAASVSEDPARSLPQVPRTWTSA